MQSEKKVIPIDIDGVAVQWQSNLPFFAAEHNIPTDRILNMMVDEKFRSMSEIFGCDDELADRLMRQYNSSKWIRGLKPYDDALIVINRLKHKYDFVAITAIGKSAESCLNRIANLNILFPSAFVDVMCVDVGESKVSRYLEAKKKYGDRMVCFVDDLAGNLEEFHGVMSTLPMIHMVRGPRTSPECFHFKATSMYDVENLLSSLESERPDTAQQAKFKEQVSKTPLADTLRKLTEDAKNYPLMTTGRMGEDWLEGIHAMKNDSNVNLVGCQHVPNSD
ncbi:hypothetical protein AVV44_gp044 [Cronobacter phage S13]|uniref:hypothetical protein n=1 Tax=Cronobacter phage S13 TaxID=1327935 RepID=UPI00049B1027|nr:hypothetical protein AVV44_gp044 [Cronobacter phage S13]AIA64843.1 hypothetical protein S13_044 [Cronobacter phage S13]